VFLNRILQTVTFYQIAVTSWSDPLHIGHGLFYVSVSVVRVRGNYCG